MAHIQMRNLCLPLKERFLSGVRHTINCLRQHRPTCKGNGPCTCNNICKCSKRCSNPCSNQSTGQCSLWSKLAELRSRLYAKYPRHVSYCGRICMALLALITVIYMLNMSVNSMITRNTGTDENNMDYGEEDYEEDIDTLFQRLDALPTFEPIDVDDNSTTQEPTPRGEFHLDPLQVEATTVQQTDHLDEMFLDKSDDQGKADAVSDEGTTQSSDDGDDDGRGTADAARPPEVDQDTQDGTTDANPEDGTLQPTVQPRDFSYALEMSKSDDNVIIMVVITQSYLPQALSFYMLSVVQHDLDNVLFIALDQQTCEQIIAERQGNDIRCFVYKTDPSSKEHVSFGSKAFNRIVNVKAHVAWKALRYGYTVLMSDVDVAYLKNPLPYLKENCQAENCDMLLQFHDPGYNSGFVYSKPTRSALKIYEEAIAIAQQNKRLSDQVALNMAIRRISSQRKIRVSTLDIHKFPVGKHFFRGMFCPPEESYKEAIVVHYNWIIGRDPKLMRAKECLLWLDDGPDNYYTSDKRKYIVLVKPIPYSHLSQGLLNLFTFAAILNRTPILPRFYVKSKKVTYPVWPLIRTVAGLHNFNNVTTNTGYRENSFLHNPRVPEKIKVSLSRVYEVTSQTDKSKEYAYLLLKDFQVGPNVDTIESWFRGEKRAVLRMVPILTKFTNLYYGKFISQRLMGMFERMAKASDLKLD